MAKHGRHQPLAPRAGTRQNPYGFQKQTTALPPPPSFRNITRKAGFNAETSGTGRVSAHEKKHFPARRLFSLRTLQGAAGTGCMRAAFTCNCAGGVAMNLAYFTGGAGDGERQLRCLGQAINDWQQARLKAVSVRQTPDKTRLEPGVKPGDTTGHRAVGEPLASTAVGKQPARRRENFMPRVDAERMRELQALYQRPPSPPPAVEGGWNQVIEPAADVAAAHTVQVHTAPAPARESDPGSHKTSDSRPVGKSTTGGTVRDSTTDTDARTETASASERVTPQDFSQQRNASEKGAATPLLLEDVPPPSATHAGGKSRKTIWIPPPPERVEAEEEEREDTDNEALENHHDLQDDTEEEDEAGSTRFLKLRKQMERMKRARSERGTYDDVLRKVLKEVQDSDDSDSSGAEEGGYDDLEEATAKSVKPAATEKTPEEDESLSLLQLPRRKRSSKPDFDVQQALEMAETYGAARKAKKSVRFKLRNNRTHFFDKNISVAKLLAT